MPTLEDVEAQAFQLASPGTLYHPDWAIPRKWRELKESGTYIGVPIADEVELDDEVDGGGQKQKAQAFTSGVVLIWRGGDRVDIV